ncbi:ABC transporter permease [Spirillospora sp. CA-294931]|uniref:ABC transporter permease n=1 Tax=Spirillospora sp. CA-294931 TaxID=3240042 RepID=UPI003D8F3648
MPGLIFTELWGRKRRLVGSLFAVFLGVAMLTGTLVLGDTLIKGIEGSVSRAYAGTDVTVRNSTSVTTEPGRLRGEIDASALDRVRAVDGVAHAEPVIQGSGQLLAKDGSILEVQGPRNAGNWLSDPALNPYRIDEGRAPRGPDEVVINKRYAKEGKLGVGDRTAVLTPRKVPVTVVGISMFGEDEAFGGTSFTAFSLEGARKHITPDPNRISAVVVRAKDGVGQDALAARVKPVLPAGSEAITGKALSDESTDQIGATFADRFRVFLGAFGGVALLVAAFSIHNTFAITVAQRVRESALLRALGAGRRQVLTMVAAEALLVGVIATLAGLAGGLSIASLLKMALSQMGMGLSSQGLVFSARTMLIAVPVGLLVTLVSALGPALKASRVAPLAALREVASEPARSSETRVIVGAVLGAVAVGAVIVGALSEQGGLTSMGAVMTMVVMVVLGPIAARPAAAVAGGPAARLRGVPGMLARDNAARSPRRTAGAATALMIGVGVVTLLTVFIGSFRLSLEDRAAGSFHGQFVVNGGFSEVGGFSPRLAEDISRLPQVKDVAGVGMGAVRVNGKNAEIRVADPTRLQRVVDMDVEQGSLAGPGTFAVSKDAADDRDLKVGSRASVTFADGSRQDFTVGAIYKNDDVAGDYLLPRTAWSAHNRQVLDTLAFITLKPGASEAEADRALTALTTPYGSPPMETRDEYITAQTENMNGFLGIVYAMLALAIIIALLGIANTLSLSVHERTRELGLLRAVGATRPQVRSMVRWESVIVALFGTAGGLGLGLFLGWALSLALGNPFAAPAVQLVIIGLIGALAGVLAAIRPARRAARMAVLGAIASP